MQPKTSCSMHKLFKTYPPTTSSRTSREDQQPTLSVWHLLGRHIAQKHSHRLECPTQHFSRTRKWRIPKHNDNTRFTAQAWRNLESLHRCHPWTDEAETSIPRTPQEGRLLQLRTHQACRRDMAEKELDRHVDKNTNGQTGKVVGCTVIGEPAEQNESDLMGATIQYTLKTRNASYLWTTATTMKTVAWGVLW